MSEQYLPVRDSLGYKEVRTALDQVFSIDLDDIQIRKGEYENFAFSFKYGGYDLEMVLSSTGKNKQFEFGEGGRFSISLPNPKYPNDSFLERIYFHNLLTDKNLISDVKDAFGKKRGSIMKSLVILKNFLDSNQAKVLLNNK